MNVRSLGAPSPNLASSPEHGEEPQTPGGEGAPNDWRYWFGRAHRAWAQANAPWLLEEWLDA